MVPPLAPSCTDQRHRGRLRPPGPSHDGGEGRRGTRAEGGDRRYDPDANASPSDVDRDGGRPASVGGAGGDEVERPLRRRGHVVAGGVHCAPAALLDRPGDGLGPTVIACCPLAAKASASPGSSDTGEGVHGQGGRVSHAAAARREKRKQTRKQKETDRLVRMWAVGRKDSRTQPTREAKSSGLGSLVARHILRHRRASVHRVAPVGAGRLERKQDVWITVLRIH